jgi:hypothetical protein
MLLYSVLYLFLLVQAMAMGMGKVMAMGMGKVMAMGMGKVKAMGKAPHLVLNSYTRPQL